MPRDSPPIDYKGLEELQTPKGRKAFEVGLEGETQWENSLPPEPTTGGILWFSEKNQDGKWDLQVASDKPLMDVIPVLKWFSDKKGLMVTNSEYIASLLKGYLDRNPDIDSEVLPGLDFMGKRNLLSETIIKKNKSIREIKSFSTPALRKCFTRSFHRFIIARNAITHGTPHVLLPQKALVLSYLDSRTKQPIRSVLGTKQIEEFHKCYYYLKDGIWELSEHLKSEHNRVLGSD